MKAPSGPPETHPQDWLKIDVAIETMYYQVQNQSGCMTLGPSAHGFEWIWISRLAIADALDDEVTNNAPNPPMRSAESDRGKIQPGVDPHSFTIGVRAMHDAICAAKYDSLQRGELDLQRFDVFAVPEPKP